MLAIIIVPKYEAELEGGSWIMKNYTVKAADVKKCLELGIPCVFFITPATDEAADYPVNALMDYLTTIEVDDGGRLVAQAALNTYVENDQGYFELSLS